MRRPYGREAGSSSIEAAVLAGLYELKIKFRMLAATRDSWIESPLPPAISAAGFHKHRLQRCKNFSGGTVEIDPAQSSLFQI